MTNLSGDENGLKLESRYGLPSKVKFCKLCVMSNQRPSSTVEFKNVDKKQGLIIHDDEICEGCRQHHRKWHEIDYEARQKVLEEVLDRHRSKDGSYDVVVPGSGGKDSFYVTHILKHKYGMHPLTVTWPPHMYTDIGWSNFERWTQEFDNISFTPSRRAHRLLTREAFLNLLHPFQPFILGQKYIGPKIAQQYGIKLVLYGETDSEAGSRVDPANPKMDPRFFAVPRAEQKNIVIGKRNYKELLDLGLTQSEIIPYLPVAIEDMLEADISVYYMSWFENWRSQEKYYYSMEHCDFQPNPERTEGTFTKFSGLDDKIDGLQFYSTYVKFGIGRATYDAAQEIRHRYISREEGVALVKRYDGEFPKKYHQECLDYMGIDEDTFWKTIDSYRSPHIWKKDGNEWIMRHEIS
ncbi:MAG TPA: N-acetyl sugar amidotransferase [Flavobacteriales bacterium]|jgi:N-acetyl sugar amidotransferase|nr:N-acetyl sugar amidotransferase [Flavobacteriales bacterium]